MCPSLPFTIVIPTKDRADTLRFSLLSALSQSYSNFKVLVSDNDSSDNTRAVVDSFADSRVHYINPGRRLSMSSHWEFALSHVDEGMVTILGDDDGLLPFALSSVNNICQTTGLKAVRSAVGLYYWPGFLDDYSYSQTTILLSDGYQIRDTQKYLQRVLDGLSVYGELPMLYTGGFVDISIVKAIAACKNPVFQSINPDIYSAIAISHFIDSYVYTQRSLAVSGHSRHSNGAAWLRPNNNANSSHLRTQFLLENDRTLHPLLLRTSPADLPLSMHLLVLDSYLHASHLHPYRPIKFSLRSQAHIISCTSKANSAHLSLYLSELSVAHGFMFSRSFLFFLNFKIGLYSICMFFQNILLSLRKVFHEGSVSSPVSNVYEAVVFASSLHVISPSRVYCFFSSLLKLIKSLRKH